MLKLLTNKLHLRVIDGLFLLLLTMITGLLYPHIGFFISPIMVLSFFCYAHKVNQYDFEESIFLSTFIMILAMIADHLTSLVVNAVFNETGFINESLLFFHAPLSVLLAILLTLLCVIPIKRIRVKINQDKRLRMLLASITTFVLLTFNVTIILALYHGSGVDLIELNLLFMLTYLFIGFIIFFFYAKILQERYAMERKKEEQERLKQYTVDIEDQYYEMRKFKHDYQNVLLSISTFIQEDDLEGLRHYYLEGIRLQSKHLLDNQFRLADLSNVREMARNMNHERKEQLI